MGIVGAFSRWFVRIVTTACCIAIVASLILRPDIAIPACAKMLTTPIYLAFTIVAVGCAIHFIIRRLRR